MSPTDLKLERLKRLNDNKECPPADLFLLVDDFLKEWPHTPKLRKAIVIIEAEKEDGTFVVEYFRAGCTRADEIAMAALYQDYTLQKWRADS